MLFRSGIAATRPSRANRQTRDIVAYYERSEASLRAENPSLRRGDSRKAECTGMSPRGFWRPVDWLRPPEPTMTCPSKHDLIVRDVRSNGFVRLGADLALRIGFTAEELSERSLEDWIHPADRTAFALALQRQGGEAAARHAARSGEWIPLHWRFRIEDDRLFAVGALHLSSAVEPAAIPPVSAGKSSMGRMLDSMARIVEDRNPGMRCSILLVDSEEIGRAHV